MMLESLYIKNFRLFNVLEIESLKRVNLFVGKNNSGKTCLLEATHNQDCVQGFHANWEKQEDKGTFYRLHHRQGKGAVVTYYDCETLSDTLDMAGEMR